MAVKRINLPKLIGRGYRDFWNCRKRYLVCKGSRGSKKSTTTAFRIIYNMMKYPLANTLVVRQVFNTHKDSTWVQLKWACHQLGVAHLWKFSKSPLEAVYIPTGQKILFRGLDDPMSITSITVEVGCLCWVWFEEAYQIKSEDDFNKIDMSIRGEIPEGYWKQLIITFNPWSDKHWLKSRFFDDPDENTFATTTTYQCNEFLGEDDIRIFESMREKNPRRYSIEGLGNWGISEGLVFENWVEEEFDLKELAEEGIKLEFTYGLDFGYQDPNALICVGVDKENKVLYIYDEFYKGGLTNKEIYEALVYKEVHKYQIICDSANPKDIEDLRRLGARRVKGAKKGKDSIINGIKTIQEYKIVVHPKCENTIIELSNYCWDNKNGVKLDKPIDDFCHLMDALRYSLEYLGKNRARVRKNSIF